MRLITVALFSILSFSAFSQQDEEKEITKTLQSFFGYLSFTDTSHLYLDSLSSVCTPDARLTANFGNGTRSFTIAQFVENIKKAISAGQTSAREAELWRKIDVFGHIAQVFST